MIDMCILLPFIVAKYFDELGCSVEATTYPIDLKNYSEKDFNGFMLKVFNGKEPRPIYIGFRFNAKRKFSSLTLDTYVPTIREKLVSLSPEEWIGDPQTEHCLKAHIKTGESYGDFVKRFVSPFDSYWKEVYQDGTKDHV